MKKWLKYVVFSMAAIILCFLYAHVDKAHYIYDGESDSSEYIAVNINKDASISQVFECTEKSFDGIAVKVLVNSISDSGKLVYDLQDLNGETLIEGKIALSDIDNGRINKIKFDKTVEGTESGFYIIYFKTEDMSEGESVGLYYDNQSNFTDDLNVNGEKINGTLILRTITYRFDIETFIVTLGFIVYFVLFFRILYRLFA
ncbi:hypothetical protein GN277_16540 [Lachnospiraceae bacterium WCA-9-b2]|uniref:Uncharacterized protein n=1 Tax=Sporofaciens musculi TaxID=2681861 RepID=A0A7X3SK19_9FIRM|nr:hypothetical protein [Sporofaciens musculi]MXP76931.1 hypothetical protein [Sporofaciens musculi]